MDIFCIYYPKATLLARRFCFQIYFYNPDSNPNLSSIPLPFQAAQKAKNRLSAACNRRSVRLPDDENDVFASSSHGPRRRPTINRKRKTSGAAEDHADNGAREETKKKEPMVTDIGKDCT